MFLQKNGLKIIIKMKKKMKKEKEKENIYYNK